MGGVERGRAVGLGGGKWVTMGSDPSNVRRDQTSFVRSDLVRGRILDIGSSKKSVLQTRAPERVGFLAECFKCPKIII